MNRMIFEPTTSPIGMVCTISMFGIFNLFKPQGMTSRDCVNAIQKMYRPLKVGHAGTLDPIAEGVLLIAVGQAVRLMDWLHELPKSYRGSFWWGRTSPSVDTETPIEVVPGASLLHRDQIDSVLPRFRGTIEQIPPVYSAVKIEGQRAYELARQGKEVLVPPRQVNILRLELVSVESERFAIQVECDRGTYIRSLGRDIARACASDAVMTALLRTSVGPCFAESSVALSKLTSRQEADRWLLNPALLIPRDKVVLSDEEVKLTRNGVYIPILQERRVMNSANRDRVQDELVAVDGAGNLRAILSKRPQEKWGAALNFDPQ